MTACSSRSIEIPTTVDNVVITQTKPTTIETENPFKEPSGNEMILGSLGHSLQKPVIIDNKKAPLRYDGGDMKIDYQVTASGTGKNVGFLLFIDGIPQPYKIDDETAPYEYLHIFNIENDDEQTNFSFLFTPIVGKTGDSREILVVSIYNPGFKPDMKESSGYGGYQSTLENSFVIDFHADPDKLPENPVLQASIATENLTYKPVTSDLYSELGTDITPEIYAERIFPRIFYNGETNVYSNLKIENNENTNIRYELSGKPGSKFITTLYIDHTPLEINGETSFEMDIKDGEYPVLDVTLDYDKLGDFNTFYIIAVPIEDTDELVSKTSSILLYKAEPAAVAAQSTSAENPPASSPVSYTAGNIPDGLISGKITNVYHSNNSSEILIAADKLYLYDLSESTVKAEVTHDSFMSEKFIPIDAGFARVIQKEPGGDIASFPSANVEFYDFSLGRTSTLNITDLLGENEWVSSVDMVDVSRDGKKVAFSSSKTFAVYDISSRKTIVLLDLSDMDTDSRQGLAIPKMLSFTADGKAIAFIGASFDVPAVAGKQSFDTYGIINIDGSGLLNKKDGSVSTNGVFAYDGFTLFTENNLPSSSGNIMLMNNVSKQTSVFKLKSAKESGNAYGSDGGKYFASATAESGGIQVRVYNTSDGSFVYEKFFTADAEHSYNSPRVKIIDDSKTIILILGNRSTSLDTIVEIDQF
jgi:hypothetical protein